MEPGSGTRNLVASSLGEIVAPRFRAAFPSGRVTVAVDEPQIRGAVTGRLRYDVVITDLSWNDDALEDTFDGLDVLDLVERLGRPALVVFARQGHGGERDHLDEALQRPGVAGIVNKTRGVDALVAALHRVAAGGTLDPPAVPQGPSLYGWFGSGRRGETAARMAGAIAAGRAANHETLASTVKCSRNTATKITDKYLGPLIRARGEHPDAVPLTTQVVYRWCGQHAPYLRSWCRRHGQADVLAAPP